MGDSRFKTGMRSDLCSGIDAGFVGKHVTLCGWVNKRRDHGKLIFMDLRDFSGIIQLVFDPNSFSGAYKSGKDIRNEFVIQASGDRSDSILGKNIFEIQNTAVYAGK